MTHNLPPQIFCDESGYTGNHLLNDDQPYFSYASHDLSIEESSTLINDAREKFSVTPSELKASRLLKRNNGKKLILHILESMKGRYKVTVHDKRFCLAGKFFEYIYDPVLQKNIILFYNNKTHFFVAMCFYKFAKDTPCQDLMGEFEALMRHLDPEKAPTLFTKANWEGFHPCIQMMLRFSCEYKKDIIDEISNLKNAGQNWMLDISDTVLRTHLVKWGEQYDIIEVVCDESKPLLSMSTMLNKMIDRPDREYTELFDREHCITWNMSKKIQFVSSANNEAIQLADLIAGAACAVMKSRDNGILESDEIMNSYAKNIEDHYLEYCILPHDHYLDFEHDEVLVNGLILKELGKRAEKGLDPLMGMEDFLETARKKVPDLRDSDEYGILKNLFS